MGRGDVGTFCCCCCCCCCEIDASINSDANDCDVGETSCDENDEDDEDDGDDVAVVVVVAVVDT